MDGARIRPAEPSDVAALSALAKHTWSDAFGDGVSAEDEAAELEEGRSEAYFAAALEETTILVAEADGVLQGYVQFGAVGIPEVAVRHGDRAVRRLYVETDLQGGGLGRKLLDAALRHPRLAAAERVFLQVWEENERALRLYESVGFRRFGTTTFSVGDQVMEDLVLVLERTDAERRRRVEAMLPEVRLVRQAFEKAARGELPAEGLSNEFAEELVREIREGRDSR